MKRKGFLLLMSSQDSAMKKILFVCPRIPEANASGAEHRSHMLYNELKKFGMVHVLTTNPSGIDHLKAKSFSNENFYLGNIPVNWNLPVSLKPVKDNPKFLDIADKNQYDLIVVRYFIKAYWLNLLGSEKLILDCDDCYLELMHQSVERSTGLMKILRTWLYRYFEPRYLNKLNSLSHVIFARESTQLAWKNNFYIVPNRLFSVESFPCFERRSSKFTVLFVGVLNYHPNWSGLDDFIERVWPMVTQEIVDAELKIVGAFLSPKLKKKWSKVKGVNVCGFVEDIADVYSGVDISISPVNIGSGTHIKVLESLAKGVPMVISSRSHRGYESTIVENECVLVAQNHRDYAHKICQLANDTLFYEKMAKNGYCAVVQYHSTFDQDDSPVRNIVEGAPSSIF
jgi:glycosyltransferase involved in cell wall biosynthesis